MTNNNRADKALKGNALNARLSIAEKKLKQKEWVQVQKGITPLPEQPTDYSNDEWIKGYRFPLSSDDLKYLNRYWPAPKRRGAKQGRPPKEPELTAEEVLEAFNSDEAKLTS